MYSVYVNMFAVLILFAHLFMHACMHMSRGSTAERVHAWIHLLLCVIIVCVCIIMGEFGEQLKGAAVAAL